MAGFDISSLGFGDLGSGIASLFGGAGDQAEAKAYDQAKWLALENATIEQTSTDIQKAQAQRQIYQVLGAQTAAYGGANLNASSGSARDVFRSSVQQGNLQKAIIELQGAVNVNGYKAAAEAYQAQENALKGAGFLGDLGGLLKIGAGIAMAFV